MAKKNLDHEAEDVSPAIIGYKFTLGVIEVLLAIGILKFGKSAFDIYRTFRSFEFFDESNDLLTRTVGSLVPYIVEHRIAIVTILFFIGIIKMVSSIAIWMGKTWGVRLLLLLMLILLPFDLFDMFRNFFQGHIGLGSMLLNAINIWIILSLTHYHPIEYFKKLDYRHLFN